MSKHTKGEWEFSQGAEYGDEGSYADITALDGDVIIAHVNTLLPAGSANGRLLAAAPCLLEALEYALPYLRACVPSPRNGVNADGSVDVNCVDRARAAIAKATGGDV